MVLICVVGGATIFIFYKNTNPSSVSGNNQTLQTPAATAQTVPSSASMVAPGVAIDCSKFGNITDAQVQAVANSEKAGDISAQNQTLLTCYYKQQFNSINPSHL